MVYTRETSAQNRAHVLLLRTECRLSYRAIARKCNISKPSVERICTNDRKTSKTFASPKFGSQKKVEERSLRTLALSFTKCWNENLNVNVTSLVQKSGFSLQQTSRRPFSKLLNEMGYFFLQARKKGLLSEADRKKRLEYAKTKKNAFWKKLHFNVTRLPFT